MIRILTFVLALLCLPLTVHAQDLQNLLQEHQKVVAKPSRKTVGPLLEALVTSGLPNVPQFLENWQEKKVYNRKDDGLFFYGEETDGTLGFIDPDTGGAVAVEDVKSLKQIKPNGGVRKEIASALVQFQLSDPDLNRRKDAVNAIARNMVGSMLAPLLGSIAQEPDAALKARKEKLANYLGARFSEDSAQRIAAIEGIAKDLSVEGRATLSQILASKIEVSKGASQSNLAKTLIVGQDITRQEAYSYLVEEAGLTPLLSENELRLALEAHVDGGKIAGVPVAQLDDLELRVETYDALAAQGVVPERVTEAAVDDALKLYKIHKVYLEQDSKVTEAALIAQSAVQTRVGVNQFFDLSLDAVSLASIYFLAAVGLAITFGVMGVINMAHGEFIMMGAYTGYVVQSFVPNYTASLIVALPLAFIVTFAAGVAMERLVIRWLYNRPLETLLATFGISVALQQLAKNIFGTQARPLTSPGWLDGAWIINDVVQISYIRIAIFILALVFLGLLLFVLKRTRLGLEVRAVTQNPSMAASMGINPDKIKMLTFGLGSGIAGIAGVAIGLFAKVTSEMGSDYIVQSFMTVVVGGVGNVWGALAGAAMIGTFQKGVEWLNPSNTLAAQTYMILFIILFIQFRPKGIIALKGRAAGD
ncbi:urea ABC transporter permease subunit UrtB [Sulfitobacter donghicola]|uniref:Branched-chain amino acid ABC transporter permease n=1 Tax=Sulfitobacter donghicola DSW-25 = KCTC 12864 = JCM 14565 TaxID=1300350 RepID=A0A073IXN5_9RHOB|nr:urea ABC transporter permease subunit UrtB [Sulfitobacter donghicola]KEJ90142.1 branched-chain amino acid ABC transporter permease [Sulfitobacter donghicola DSW-25 = KCTC 12864 = JCM 14565]KIN66703.1 Branched-chain amino acid ABC transporter, permease protein [Sulfitobacter donghicola DSW-25 = KCTC 12864 = JCM 14565]